jgi:hypothetical protein
MERPNGLRQPPTAEYGSVNRDAVRHRTGMENRSDRAVGCTLCWAAIEEMLSSYCSNFSNSSALRNIGRIRYI